MFVETDVLIVVPDRSIWRSRSSWGRGASRALLVERNERGGAAPRAKTSNVRTRTHFRRWGIADKLAAAAPGWTQAHKHSPTAMYWQIGKDGGSALGPMDSNDIGISGRIRRSWALPKEEVAAFIHDRTGIDLPFEVLSAVSDLIADRYAQPSSLPGRRSLPPPSASQRLRHEHEGGRRRRIFCV